MDPTLEPWIFRLPDLHEFPAGSLPSPYGLMHPVRRLPPGLRLLAVGWIDGPTEFATGPTDPDVVSKLLRLGDAFLIDEGTAGYHSCYYCKPEDFETDDDLGFGGGRRGSHRPWDHRPQSPVSKGHNLVQLGADVYMSPALLPHYVLKHGYRPPDVFQDAVRSGTFLADGDLIYTGEDLREVALQRSLAVAEASGDAERAESYRAAIQARREELGLAGRVVSSTGPPAVERTLSPARPPSDRVLFDQSDPLAPSVGISRVIAWLRGRWRG